MVYGSGKVVKPFLKRRDAIKSLSARAKKNIAKKFPEPEEENVEPLPAQLREMLQPLMETLNTYKNKVMNDEPVLKNAIARMTDSQLATLKEIYGKKTGISSEDKLIQSGYVVMKELQFLDRCVPVIQKLKQDLISTYVDAFANEFCAEKGSEYVFANDIFVGEVNKTISYRDGIKRAVEMANANENPQQEVPRAEEASCSVM